jgi:hypothetical protein
MLCSNVISPLVNIACVIDKHNFIFITIASPSNIYLFSLFFVRGFMMSMPM